MSDIKRGGTVSPGVYRPKITCAANTAVGEETFPTDQEIADATLAGLKAAGINVVSVNLGGVSDS